MYSLAAVLILIVILINTVYAIPRVGATRCHLRPGEDGVARGWVSFKCEEYEAVRTPLLGCPKRIGWDGMIMHFGDVGGKDAPLKAPSSLPLNKHTFWPVLNRSSHLAEQHVH